jgi:hypothetical protein
LVDVCCFALVEVMKKLAFVVVLVGGLMLSACETTSISNPGTGSGRGGDRLYRGELQAMDVLGLPVGQISEAEIRAAFGGGGGPVRVPAGTRVMLVQSGALVPDAALVEALSAHCEVLPFTGQPERGSGDEGVKDASKRLRLAAARAGAARVVVVWGKLETARQDNEGNLVSWLPLVGQVVPDGQVATRLTLSAVVMETVGGRWGSVSPPPTERRFHSSQLRHSGQWARQVEELKAESYPKLAAMLR